MTTDQLNAFILRALVVTWTVLIPAFVGIIGWYLRRDRDSFFEKVRLVDSRVDLTNEHMDEFEGRFVELDKSVAQLDAAVFGIDGEGGAMKWEVKMRSVMQPFTSELETVGTRLDKFALALARAVPGIELRDLQ